MAKITNVMIKDHNTLIINQEAKPGDEIDLLSINSVDTSILARRIKEGKDEEFNRLLAETKKSLRNELLNEFNEKEQKYRLEIEKQKNNAQSMEREHQLKVEAAINSVRNEYLAEITKLKNQIESYDKDKSLAITQIESAYKEEINNLKSSKDLQTAELKEQYEEKLNQGKLELALEKLEYERKLQEKENELNKFKLSKSSLSVKRLGEELESWCNNEYLDYSQMGFSNCTWEKDNTSVKEEGEKKGTKADYIFRVFANDELNPSEELSSVCCEMKNEDPLSTTKKKNSDHYAKLDKDRVKKNCKYALLISELEWDQENDVPVRKVNGYKDMYVVRPQYFITFLSIVASLTLKFKDLYLEKQKELMMFKDSEEILNEFEEMKNNLLDKQLKYMENEILKINDAATKIKQQADKIFESTEKIAVSYLVSIKNKIEGFNINKIIKKINKL